MSKEIEARVIISGRKEIVHRMIGALKFAERLGNIGHSATVMFSVDGDGWERPVVTSNIDPEAYETEKYDQKYGCIHIIRYGKPEVKEDK